MAINDNITEKKKILYFDDEPFISEALVDSLTLYDWDVTFVSDINELFNELNRHKFDILILDIMAPIPEMENLNVSFSKREIEEMDEGMNTGAVLAKKIWEINHGEYKSMPILFLSARRPASITNISKIYRFDYMRKPVLADDLSDRLLYILNNKINSNE